MVTLYLTAKIIISFIPNIHLSFLSKNSDQGIFFEALPEPLNSYLYYLIFSPLPPQNIKVKAKVMIL